MTDGDAASAGSTGDATSAGSTSDAASAGSTGDADGGLATPTLPRVQAALPVDERDGRWLGLALLPGFVAVGVYLATNPYPAYGAGLYVEIARAIAANGYLPPTSVSGYAEVVPFAYPPLQFYVLAVLLDLGGDPLTVARLLPGVAVVAGLIPAYLLGRDHTGSRAAGAATAAAVALNPQVLEWHVSAGGVVRGFAFLYALTAVYAGYHVFAGDRGAGRPRRAGSAAGRRIALPTRRAVVVGAVAVALTGLTHPTYALFAVSTYVVFWAALDRSIRGLGRGLAVGLGALALASPWLGWVVATHGVGAFTAAAGTHGGIGGGLELLLGGASVYELVPLAAALVALVLRRDALVAGWTVVAALLFSQPRFEYTAGALALASAGLAVADRLGGDDSDPIRRHRRRSVAAAALVVLASVGGGVYFAAAMTGVADPSTPSFVDDESVAMASWAESETPADATFFVLGDAAEWFPVLSGRSIEVGPWGVEWRHPETYERHYDAFEDGSACHSSACVERAAESVDANPDYVVVPRGRYTVRGHAAVQFGTLERSFELADEWTRAYENEGVVVFRATDGDATGDDAVADSDVTDDDAATGRDPTTDDAPAAAPTAAGASDS